MVDRIAPVDHEWLEQIRTEIRDGYFIEGAYVGGTNGVLKLVGPKGKAMALRFDRNLLLFPGYIREIPRWMSKRPQYDVDRLNRKLSGLLGDPNLHLLVKTYDSFFYSILASFREDGVVDLDQLQLGTEAQTVALQVVLKSPPIAYRLEQWCSDEREATRTWAHQARESIARIPDPGPTFAPDTLLDNPLFVWGGAVLEDYFEREQFAQLSDVLAPQFESVSESQGQAFLTQMAIVATLMSAVFGQCPRRLALFLDALGAFPSIEFATDEDRNAPDELIAFNDSIFRGL
jgi:hypothetical protein